MKIYKKKKNRGDFIQVNLAEIEVLIAGKIEYKEIPPVFIIEGRLIIFQKQINDFYKSHGFKAYDTVKLVHDKNEVNNDLKHVQLLESKFSEIHSHQDKEARWTISGYGSFFIPVNEFILRFDVYTGDFIIVNEGVEHSYELPDDSQKHCLLRFFSSKEGRT
jgi:cupin superfamily acireductone dioxygenase involved in methionine salvage